MPEKVFLKLINYETFMTRAHQSFDKSIIGLDRSHMRNLIILEKGESKGNTKMTKEKQLCIVKKYIHEAFNYCIKTHASKRNHFAALQSKAKEARCSDELTEVISEAISHTEKL